MNEITSLGPVHRGLGSIRNLDYTILLCDNLDPMRRFYAETLGLSVHEEVPGRWVSLRIGSSLVALRRRGRDFDGDGPPAGSASVQLAFRVPPGDVSVAADQLAAQGIELLVPMTDERFGHRTLFFADPEGNVIEIYAEI